MVCRQQYSNSVNQFKRLYAKAHALTNSWVQARTNLTLFKSSWILAERRDTANDGKKANQRANQQLAVSSLDLKQFQSLYDLVWEQLVIWYGSFSYMISFTQFLIGWTWDPISMHMILYLTWCHASFTTKISVTENKISNCLRHCFSDFK